MCLRHMLNLKLMSTDKRKSSWCTKYCHNDNLRDRHWRQIKLALWKHRFECYNFFSRCIMFVHAQIAKFMGPTWGPPGSWRPQMGPMLAPWILLSGWYIIIFSDFELWFMYNRKPEPLPYIREHMTWPKVKHELSRSITKSRSMPWRNWQRRR